MNLEVLLAFDPKGEEQGMPFIRPTSVLNSSFIKKNGKQLILSYKENKSAYNYHSVTILIKKYCYLKCT